MVAAAIVVRPTRRGQLRGGAGLHGNPRLGVPVYRSPATYLEALLQNLQTHSSPPRRMVSVMPPFVGVVVLAVIVLVVALEFTKSS